MNNQWSHNNSKWSSDRRRPLSNPKNPITPLTFYRGEKSKMDKFWELLQSSTIFQGGITLAFVTTTCYLWATGQQVPNQLWTADLIVIGFFFGSKSTQAATQIQNLRRR